MKLLVLCSILLVYCKSVDATICYKCLGDLSGDNQKGACFDTNEETPREFGCDYCLTRLSNDNKTIVRICGDERIQAYPGEKCETKEGVTECTCNEHYCNTVTVEPDFKRIGCYECEGENDVGNCYKPDSSTKTKDGCQHCMTRERIDDKKIKRSCEPYTREVHASKQDCYNFKDTEWVDARTCDCRGSDLCNSLTISEMANLEAETSSEETGSVTCYVCEESKDGILYGGGCYKPDHTTSFEPDCEHCMTKRWDGDVKIKRSCEGNTVDETIYYVGGPCYSNIDDFSKGVTVCDCKKEDLCNNVPVIIPENDTTLVNCYDCTGYYGIGDCFNLTSSTNVKNDCHHCMTKIWEKKSQIERRCEPNTIYVKPIGQECYPVTSGFRTEFTVCDCRDSNLCNDLPAKETLSASTTPSSPKQFSVVSCFDCEESVDGSKIGGNCYEPDNNTRIKRVCDHCLTKRWDGDVKIKRSCEGSVVEIINKKYECYTHTTEFSKDSVVCDCKFEDNCNSISVNNPKIYYQSHTVRPFWQFGFNNAVIGSSPFVVLSLIPLLLIRKF